MARIFIITFFLVGITAGFSQKGLDLLEDDIIKAQYLKQQYEDEDVVFLYKNVDITFDKNRDGLVEVTKTSKIHLINISSTARLQFPVFYDSESEIEDFDIMERTGQSKSSRIFDEYINSEDLFHSDYRVKYSNLTLPVQAATFTILTEKKIKDIKYFTSEYFSSSKRVISGTLNIEVPEWLNLDIKEFNFEGFDISKKSEPTRKGNLITFNFNNIPPRSIEPYAPGPSFLYPHVLFVAKSINDKKDSKILFNSTSDLYKWYNSLVESVEVDSSVFTNKVKELTENATSDEEKIKNIYYWVQDNIRYIAFEDGIAGFKPDSPQQVFEKRYGDCKGMAFLTKAMLEQAGFDSRLVWIGTDRLAYDYSTPSLSVDNHMICSVLVDGQPIFLDATEKYNRFGEYASRIQNKQAMMQSPDEDGYKLIMVPPVSEVSNMDKTNYSLSLEGETLVGKAIRSYVSECRVQFQNNYLSLAKGDQDKALSGYLASGNSNYKVNDIQPFDFESREKDLNVAYTLNIDNAVVEFDGVMYIDIDPIKTGSEYILTDRKVDFKLPVKQKKVVEISLDIPENYKVKALPKSLSISNDFIDIDVNYSQKENKIYFTRNINFKKQLIKKGDFEQWNNSFYQLKENLSQQITLAKL
ncbi:transglutaminase domain-containing protein [Marixanthomonas ophiurae]|uniref:DUF3858 domain-containing protein n=1 Tax=Marixanthomonas ophiurae TaxID=387659 RepID=A0A3E1Q6X8_9FLAO|nr:DUF3858 domain-containing protein [Marixanthomonas ophiurae]RFN57870.1 DUF3858 domain-containing protein [Marixanthomonas ophiurae]